jgi:DNA-binding protein HU-beta
MNKKDLVSAIAAEAGLTQADAAKALNATVSAVLAVAAKEDRVAIPGLGTFRGKMRPERQARNPKTGEAVTVPAKRVLTFKASSGVTL